MRNDLIFINRKIVVQKSAVQSLKEGIEGAVLKIEAATLLKEELESSLKEALLKLEFLQEMQEELGAHSTSSAILPDKPKVEVQRELDDAGYLRVATVLSQLTNSNRTLLVRDALIRSRNKLRAVDVKAFYTELAHNANLDLPEGLYRKHYYGQKGKGIGISHTPANSNAGVKSLGILLKKKGVEIKTSPNAVPRGTGGRVLKLVAEWVATAPATEYGHTLAARRVVEENQDLFGKLDKTKLRSSTSSAVYNMHKAANNLPVVIDPKFPNVKLLRKEGELVIVREDESDK